jgi:outer membrane protein OmpA-like peptidoglycan-associated protein
VNFATERDPSRNGVRILIAKLEATLVPQLPGLQIEEDPNDPFGVLVIPPKTLERFVRNRFELPPQAGEYLERFAPKLATAVCGTNARAELSSVVVEGHADHTGTDEINLNLSTERSMSVVSTCLHAVGSDSAGLPETTVGCFAQLLTASGRGRSDPIRINGVEDADRSRRVVFKLRLKTIEEKELEREGSPTIATGHKVQGSTVEGFRDGSSHP